MPCRQGWQEGDAGLAAVGICYALGALLDLSPFVRSVDGKRGCFAVEFRWRGLIPKGQAGPTYTPRVNPSVR